MAKFLSEDGLRYFYNQIKSKFAAASHKHSAGDIASGTLPIARGGTGQTKAADVRNALGLGNTTGAVPIANGGTGATNVAAAVKALLGSSAIGSSTKPLYYDGAALKACADSIGGGGIVAQLLEQNGYVKFANGLILQWGLTDTTEQNIVHTLPISYSKSHLWLAIIQNKYDSHYGIGGNMQLIKAKTLTSFSYLPIFSLAATYISLGK